MYNYLSKELVKELREKVRVARKKGAYRITAFSCLNKRYIADTPCKITPFLSWLDSVNARGKVNTRKICVDTYEYAALVDKNPEVKETEKELCDAVCLLIGRAVRKHFADKENKS